jgi:hypothetical protein
MGDFSSPRIEGIADRETQNAPGEQEPGKRKLKSEEKPKLEPLENVDIVIETAEHELDEMA